MKYGKFFESMEPRQLLSASILGEQVSTAHAAMHAAIVVASTATTLAAPPVTTAGDTRYTFTVSYARRGEEGRLGNVLVTGPNGFRANARLIATKATSRTGVTATYTIRPPGGAWSATANGAYIVSLGGRGDSDEGEHGQGNPARQLGTFQVNIGATTPAVNAAPSFTAGGNQTVAQDAGAQTVANWASNISAGPASEAGQTLTFLTSTSNDALFAVKPTVSANGTLTYTPAAGASGMATVTVALKDSGGTANGGVDTSAAKTFTITVTAPPPVVNVAPSFTAGANQTVAQDAGAQTVANWASNISAGPASEAGQTLTFLTSTSNDALFAVKPTVSANGTLTYTPAAGASGMATVTVALKDSGGTANGGVDTSAARTFTITLTPAAPVIPSLVGTYAGTLIIPAVGHNRPGTLTITSQAADGSFVGTLLSVSGSITVSVNVTGMMAADGTFTMTVATPAGTSHPGGPINGTATGSLSGKNVSISFIFTPNMPGTYTGTKP